MRKKFIFLLILIILASITNSLIFTSPVTITPTIVNTLSDLNCSWNLSIDATQWNASWYNGSKLFKTYSFNTTNKSFSIILNHTYTYKHETWKCVVNATNGSTIIGMETNVTINNSPPQDLTLYYYNTTTHTWREVSTLTTLKIKEDTLNRFEINATDIDNDTLTYSFTHVNPPETLNNYSFFPTTGSFNWTPVHSEVGNHKFLFTALDTDNEGRSNAYNITVIEVNDPPFFNPALADQEVLEGNCSWQYIIYGDDEETPNGGFNFSIINITPNLSSTLNITNIDNKSARIFFNDCPTFNDKGNHTITVLIQETNDSYTPLKNNTDSFVLEVIPINHVPEINAVNYTEGIENHSFFFEFNATDIDNDTLSFSVVPLECTSNINNPWDNYLSINLTHNHDGNTSLGIATLNISATNFTNDFVVCSGNIKLIVSDGKENNSKIVFFNISNINNPPIIHEMSFYDNYLNQHNMSNLTAYVNARFFYRINVTDLDLLLIPRFSEQLNYTTNDTRFEVIDGWLNITPNSSMIGNYSINITVIDINNSMNSAVMHLQIKNNSKPYLSNISLYINNSLIISTNNSESNLTALEDESTIIDINATDEEDCQGIIDCGNITYSMQYEKIDPNSDSINLSINNERGIISFTPTQEVIGRYNLTIYINDSFGAVTTLNIELYLNNTNDKPNIESIVKPEKIVEDYPATLKIYSSDQDLLLNNSQLNGRYGYFNENLSLITNITWSYEVEKINDTTFYLTFTPNSSLVGNHTIWVYVNDSRNDYMNCSGINNQTISFEVLPRTNDPVIQNISVYDLNNSMYILNWTKVFDPDIAIINVNTSENRSLLINLTGYNDEYNFYDLNFTWIWDNNTLTTTGSNERTINLDFFSAGTHNLTIVVGDTRFNKDNITIRFNVSNINRPPVLLNPLINLSGNNSVDPYFEDPNYFTGIWTTPNIEETANFYDYDREELTFTIDSTNCNGIADISINGSGIKVYGRTLGNCYAVFKARDPYGAEAISNNVTIMVTDILPQENVQQPTSGGGSSTTVPIPIEEEVETPDPINIIAPALVTIYSNKSIKIPIVLNNTWSSDIRGITLSAKANVSNISMSFSESNIKVIPYKQKYNVELFVTNYRIGENFEIVVSAKVLDPDFTDTALIMINSLEAAKKGEDFNVKVTFARDFLGQNPECVELNELLDEAKQIADNGDYDKAMEMVQGVIDGCKYLISKSKTEKENPKTLERYIKDKIIKNPNVWLAAILIVGLLTLILIEAYRMVRIKEEEE